MEATETRLAVDELAAMILEYIEGHHYRGDEVVSVWEVAHAIGEYDERRVRAVMDALVCSDELACRFPDYWIEGCEVGE